MRIFGFEITRPPRVKSEDIKASTLGAFTGEKFRGGLAGVDLDETTDYETLRSLSAAMFRTNPYAKGILRRLITNEINSGLQPEATPLSSIVSESEDSLAEWTEQVENRFRLWSKDKEVCDYTGTRTFGEIQQLVRLESLICGDVLVVVHTDRDTGVPSLQVIPGDLITSSNIPELDNVYDGVEIDQRGRQVAYHVRGDLGDTVRVPAYGEKSGRRVAWLVHGGERRASEVRGTPILSCIIQSLKEIDRYRDSAQRKAVINSMVAMFIKKSQDKMSSLPLTGGSARRGSAKKSEDKVTTNPHRRTVSNDIPGLVLEELQVGEEPVGFHNQGTDQAFSSFEDAIVSGVAWSLEIPPEILKLSFSSNYSASQAAINEFKSYLQRFWVIWGDMLCQTVYEQWLTAEVVAGRVNAPELREAMKKKNRTLARAWMSAEWYGHVKPHMDPRKTVAASVMLIENGLSTYAREARGINGSKFSDNVRRVKKELEQLRSVKDHEMVS